MLVKVLGSVMEVILLLEESPSVRVKVMVRAMVMVRVRVRGRNARSAMVCTPSGTTTRPTGLYPRKIFAASSATIRNFLLYSGLSHLS